MWALWVMKEVWILLYSKGYGAATEADLNFRRISVATVWKSKFDKYIPNEYLLSARHHAAP